MQPKPVKFRYFFPSQLFTIYSLLQLLYVGIRHGLDQSVMVDTGDNAQLSTVHLNGADNTYSTKLILAYGPQENELDDVKDIFHQKVSLQIETALISGSNVILAGDINVFKCVAHQI